MTKDLFPSLSLITVDILLHSTPRETCLVLAGGDVLVDASVNPLEEARIHGLEERGGEMEEMV